MEPRAHASRPPHSVVDQTLGAEDSVTPGGAFACPGLPYVTAPR